MKKVLVTGAAGFIGSHLCSRLLERGDVVTGLDNINDYYDVNLKLERLKRLEARQGFGFVKLDLQDRAAMEKLFAEGCYNAVVNLAAQAGAWGLVMPRNVGAFAAEQRAYLDYHRAKIFEKDAGGRRGG